MTPCCARIHTRRVTFVAPLPPPTHGFSGISAAVLPLLQNCAAVHVCDRAPRRNQLLTALGFLRESLQSRPDALYVALSGGYGQLVDLLYLLVGCLLGSRIHIHHHSFAYLRKPNVLSRLVLRVAKRAMHIVLSPNMGRMLASSYGISEGNIRGISNAAFLSPPSPAPERNPGRPLQIGFLSNITFDKGFVEFFEVVNSLSSRGVSFEARIAGPVAPDARAGFESRLASAANVTYRGPLYGDDKESFYRSLDVFLLPTSYVNEAEPLVIHEALRQGAYVIATDRGAISEMLQAGGGVAFDGGRYVELCVARLLQLLANRAELARLHASAWQSADASRQRAGEALDHWLGELCGTSDT